MSSPLCTHISFLVNISGHKIDISNEFPYNYSMFLNLQRTMEADVNAKTANIESVSSQR